MIPVLPDATGIAIDWLLDHVAVSELVDDRTWPRPAPRSDDDYPFLTVRRIGGAPETYHAIDKAQLEIAAWSYDRPGTNGDPEALLVCETAIAALHQAAEADGPLEITDVEDLEGAKPIPDPVRDRPRCIGTVLLTIVPLPVGDGS